MASSTGAYQGTRHKLVLSFDVGTTFSGVSYSILDPGRVPQIQGVTRSSDHTGTVCKIPTVVYYDNSGKVCAAGAEALRDGINLEAEENGWVKAEWFKLHLRPRAGGKELLDSEIPPLPPKKTVVEVFADFLRYLLECTAQFIQESHLNGKKLWASNKHNLYFVLPHPNGWGGREQALMRRASILAGLIPDTPSVNARVSFVTEGEASLHFAIQHNFHDMLVSGTF
ncbi:hypothetical protein M413DRAFT_20825 [Hebeloma cylindrosporum]|uniref:Uncharacterized protein n=1 Tax=Hebeloma cylindrosporum TaxID=76867 RepID=A0A0C3BE15_HEBCY|nr:hypothetical protein M413DRAFT_20825 [Hebeloma cylindrosporum h7]